MNISTIFLLLQIFVNGLMLISAQWCVSFRSVIKTRVQWNNGQRLLSKRTFLGGIKYTYEPYVYSTIQNYHDYERVNVCCDGYTAVGDSKCEPVCKPSCPINTHCIRPDICECDMGYRGYTANAQHIQCEPFCKPVCMENAECIEPNKCRCNKGYADTEGQGTCQPICRKCPENSTCMKPDQCACNAGYLDNGLGQCKPVCSPKCPDYSECTKPETCTCQQNYKEENGKCMAICEKECPHNAHCGRPNECDCDKGYEAIEYQNSTTFTCIAKCAKPCPDFANCTQPNTCECQQGYNRTQVNLCEPLCANGCPEHSSCREPNVCNCDKGYAMLEQKCQPICEKACPEHANCSEPNKCMCENGYQMKLSSIYNLYCEPVCQRNCSTFGKCVEPNKCECLEGYKMDELEVCQPVCSRGCKNGLCFQPEVCICNPGYLMGPREECEPACSMPCQNGSCIEPEICQCYDGFRLQNKSINICEPICRPECKNGICVGPQVCICHENYEPTKTELGLNHSDCQLIKPLENRNKETTTFSNEVNAQDVATSMATISFSTLQPDFLGRTSLRTLPSADECHESCQCWQEFDEFGPLANKRCVHLCVDQFDKPCLDLKLCQCDLDKNQLVCRTSVDDLVLDDPLIYTCIQKRLQASTSSPNSESISSDMNRIKPADESTFNWWWVIALTVFISLCILSALLYAYFRKVEDPIMDYEL